MRFNKKSYICHGSNVCVSYLNVFNTGKQTANAELITEMSNYFLVSINARHRKRYERIV